MAGVEPDDDLRAGPVRLWPGNQPHPPGFRHYPVDLWPAQDAPRPIGRLPSCADVAEDDPEQPGRTGTLADPLWWIALVRRRLSVDYSKRRVLYTMRMYHRYAPALCGWSVQPHTHRSTDNNPGEVDMGYIRTVRSTHDVARGTVTSRRRLGSSNDVGSQRAPTQSRGLGKLALDSLRRFYGDQISAMSRFYALPGDRCHTSRSVRIAQAWPWHTAESTWRQNSGDRVAITCATGMARAALKP